MDRREGPHYIVLSETHARVDDMAETGRALDVMFGLFTDETGDK